MPAGAEPVGKLRAAAAPAAKKKIPTGPSSGTTVPARRTPTGRPSAHWVRTQRIPLQQGPASRSPSGRSSITIRAWAATRDNSASAIPPGTRWFDTAPLREDRHQRRGRLPKDAPNAGRDQSDAKKLIIGEGEPIEERWFPKPGFPIHPRRQPVSALQHLHRVRRERVYSSDPVRLVSEPMEGASARMPRKKTIHGTQRERASKAAAQESGADADTMGGIRHHS